MHNVYIYIYRLGGALAHGDQMAHARGSFVELGDGVAGRAASILSDTAQPYGSKPFVASLIISPWNRRKTSIKNRLRAEVIVAF